MQAGALASNEDDHYKILNLPRPHNPDSSKESKDELKAAYHRTLLLHHPDKVKNSTLKEPRVHKDVVVVRNAYSVDQIMQAYQTLADPVQRSAYDVMLLRKPLQTTQDGLYNGTHLGVDNFDLEELDYQEEAGTWSKACRCGSDGGYSISEADLEKESSEGEIYVGCRGCSLFIKVLFAVDQEKPST